MLAWWLGSSVLWGFWVLQYGCPVIWTWVSCIGFSFVFGWLGNGAVTRGFWSVRGPISYM